MRQQLRIKLGPFVLSGDPSAGARPASRRSNLAAMWVGLAVLAIVSACAIGGAFL